MLALALFLLIAWVLVLWDRLTIWYEYRHNKVYYRTRLIWLDALANTLAFGHPFNTVSGRAGYFAYIRKSRYWQALSWIINWAFYPIDGPDHCRQVMENDPNGGFTAGGYLWIGLMGLGIACLCPLIRIVTQVLAYRK